MLLNYFEMGYSSAVIMGLDDGGEVLEIDKHLYQRQTNVILSARAT